MNHNWELNSVRKLNKNCKNSKNVKSENYEITLLI